MIQVQIDDQAPTSFEVVFQQPGVPPHRLGREHPYTASVEEAAFALVLRCEVRPLPVGAIRALVACDAYGHHPQPEDVGRAIARRILL